MSAKGITANVEYLRLFLLFSREAALLMRAVTKGLLFSFCPTVPNSMFCCLSVPAKGVRKEV